MTFLTPLFFVGLAALAVPVLIHLIQRERKQLVVFPSLMFIRRIPYKSIRRRCIHNWLLLAIRLLAMTLIVTAFARPFLHRPASAAATGADAREVVILLDQSYSMGYGGRWERVRARTRDALRALGPSDRASLVLFASRAEVAVRSTVDRGRVESAIEAASPSVLATRYAPALQVAGSLLAGSQLPRREVMLITDFQRVGWRGAEGAELPPGVMLTPVHVDEGDSAANLSLTPVSLNRSVFANQERVAVTAGVLNRSAAAARDVELTLEIDGRAIQRERGTIEPNGSASVTFAPVTIAHQIRGTVRLPADGLTPDNAFHFVAAPSTPLPVVVVERDRDAGLYLGRALSIGDSPRFDLRRRLPDDVSEADLAAAAVVLLNDVPVSPALANRLARYVERGGGLFLAVGSRATWPRGQATLLPATLSTPVDRTRGEPARLSTIEYGHPVFEVFRAPRSGDFAGARFYGLRSLIAVRGTGDRPDDHVRVLARFDTGAPALMERTAGRGRVLVWASTLDLSWGDLPLKPVFLPFVHRVVRHLAGYVEPAPWVTVGQVLDPSGAHRAKSERGVVLTPSGRRLALDDEGADVLEISEQGFYEIRGTGGGGPGVVVAANVDLAESDLTPVDPREMVAATTSQGAAGVPGDIDVPLTPEAQEREQRVWWYLLFSGLALLAAETLVSNRVSHA